MVDIETQIKAVEREIFKRRQVFPRLVQQQKMTTNRAEVEIAAMQAVLQTLQGVLAEHPERACPRTPDLFPGTAP